MKKPYPLWLFPLLVFHATGAGAFPPYRSTDADTAEPRELQLRIGLVKLDRDKGDTAVVTPLLRANLGFQNKLELVTEFEYSPEDNEVGEGAIGIKWIPFFGEAFSFGVESLALLPVRPGDEGAGFESQLVATFWREAYQVHLNAGGYYDDRTEDVEKGWRSSLLAEFPRGDARFGLELFARDAADGQIDIRAGAGVIYSFGATGIRSGLHAGITRGAPDISFNFWVTRSFMF